MAAVQGSGHTARHTYTTYLSYSYSCLGYPSGNAPDEESVRSLLHLLEGDRGGGGGGRAGGA